VSNTIKVRLDVATVSESNTHEHWRKRQKRASRQRGLVSLVLRRLKPRPPCTVTITRVSPRALDSDNIHGALKHVRDGVADAMGIDDRDPRVTWLVEQRKGATRERGVEIAIVES
jgi:hypothetical protein